MKKIILMVALLSVPAYGKFCKDGYMGGGVLNNGAYLEVGNCNLGLIHTQEFKDLEYSQSFGIIIKDTLSKDQKFSVDYGVRTAYEKYFEYYQHGAEYISTSPRVSMWMREQRHNLNLTLNLAVEFGTIRYLLDSGNNEQSLDKYRYDSAVRVLIGMSIPVTFNSGSKYEGDRNGSN